MRLMKWLVPGLVVLFFILLNFSSRLYLDWVWFNQLGFAGVFTTILGSFWAVRLAAWLFFAVFLYVNLYLTQRAVLDMPNLVLRQVLMNSPGGNMLTKRRLNRVFLLASLLIPVILTSHLGAEWMRIRFFFAGGEAGLVDPIFNRDVGFYIFRLPFFDLLYQYLMAVLVVSIMLCGAIYLFINPPQQLGLRGIFARRGQVHLSLLLALTFLTRAFGYHLQALGLVFSPRGAAFGAGYADVAAQLPAYRVLAVLAILAAAALLVNARLRSPRLIAGSVVLLVAASVLLGGVWPGFVQKFQVEPNEFAREEEFLRHNIQFTRIAYGLNDIQRREFPLTGALGYGELLANEGTINNIRLWDWRPLRDTFGQLQGLRPYYRFFDVDTDRYMIDGQYRQIMLSAREMNVDALPARSWINERLIYTHGYGVVASPVNEVSGQGQPNLLLRDFPVAGPADIRVDVPQIYYGELTNNYIFTGALTDEFDYPQGEQNAFTRYDGEGGIPLGGILRQLLFSLRFSDYRLLISSELQAGSRVHFYRNIRERTQKVAPFLQYDGDPYLVINNGRLFWLIDAYTTTDRFPYSEPYQRINYIRNSVKVVVDAYDGTVKYYISDPDDILIQAYDRIFPGLFTPIAQMPEGLRKHIRYPEQMFKIQSRVYATYQMQNTQVFYNREDRWDWPKEIYQGSAQTMEPYYTIIRLPDGTAPEFVLMLPYTPYNRDNMVAWLAGRSDGDNYGELIVYQFPKGELLYGPAQIEARIDQDPRISEQLSLWNQRGSSVIRGNLLVLPIRGSVLYVEPLYLRSDQSQFPELARVIVAYGERVVMERTLDEALAAVFGLTFGQVPGTPEPPVTGEPVIPGEPVEGELHELIRRASQAFILSEEAVRRGDWAEYGRLQQELGSILIRLEQLGAE
ncbi:MAG: UPF0182 family protein [Dethiobacter sp.]|jgi:uncharacterized membrane protein (UPF0182 family)|nr:UPF0182 family protein [Dethiobacter sp.]